MSPRPIFQGLLQRSVGDSSDIQLAPSIGPVFVIIVESG